MHYRFIAMLVCFISLQSSAMTEGLILRRTMTMSPSVEIGALASLSFLPTSAPETPQDAVDRFIKTTKSSCDFTTLVRKEEKRLADLEHVKKYMNASMFIKKLQEEKRAEKQRELEEQKREEEKKLAEKKYQEWLQYVRESNSYGYSPHSGNVYEASSVSTNNNNQGDWYP